MERTGHRSTDGVRVYKRSSAEQQAFLSKVLNRETAATTLLPPSAFEKENVPPATTSATVKKKESTSPHSFPSVSFSGCTGVTINYNFGSH